MLSHEEMVGIQSEKHGLIDALNFRTKELYVLHLIHTFAYVQASSLAENKTVLDLGCNTGYGSEILWNFAKRVVGVDVSEKALSFAKNQYGHLGIDFKLIDGKQLPFEDNEFDMIVSCQVIEHIVNHNVYINELKRVLSPSGMVFFTTPNALIRLDPGMKPWNKFHVREFDHSELEDLLKTYFTAVQIMGLFAKEPLSSIEINRLNRARERGRRKQTNENSGPLSHYRDSFKSLIKKILPNNIIDKLDKILMTLSYNPPAVDKAFINEHGHGDLSYRPDDLRSALDLLAICTDDESVMQNIKNKLFLLQPNKPLD